MTASCLESHGKGINLVMVDGSVQRFRPKQLWTLHWSKTFQEERAKLAAERSFPSPLIREHTGAARTIPDAIASFIVTARFGRISGKGGGGFQPFQAGRKVHTTVMPVQDHTSPPPMASGATFHTTHWSVVLAARDAPGPQAGAALETLCRTYWYPLYAFVRRQGYAAAAAEDLTQGFFARLLEKHYLPAVDPTKGRFRSFLLASLKHFLANEWDRQTALKRGGRCEFISLEAAGAEVEFQAEARRDLAPDRLYERRWALAVLEEARRRLEADYRAQGKPDLFASLSAHLAGDPEALPYAEVAGPLGLSAEAARKAVERMRRRYGQLLREVVAQTVATPEEIDEELRHLRSLLQT